MTLDNDRNPIAPHHPSDPPPRRPAAEGAQTGAEGVAAPAAAPVTTSPVKSTRAEGEGSPASAQPSTPAAPRILRLTVAPADDLDALLAAVGEQCERNCNGDLAISLAAARRIVDGRSPHAADGTVADALAWLLVDLRRDIRDAARGYREAVHELACARRNDDDATVARCAERLRSARAEVARVGALAGRIAAAVTAAEE